MGALSSENEGTGVIFGFLMQVLAYAKEHQTNDIIFCWDSVNSKRKEVHPEYKANRTSEDLSDADKAAKADGYKQFDILRKEVLPLMGFKNIYYQDKYEADDLIATTVMYHEKDFVIITSDQDMYQLLDFASVWNPSKKEMYSYEDFYEEWNLVPEEWIKIKTLAGCSSDNVIGIKGVGEKTVAKFLKNELKPHLKSYQKIMVEMDEVKERNKILVELPFPGSHVFKIQPDELNFNNFVQKICYRYSFDSFLNDKYYIKWENFFHNKF